MVPWTLLDRTVVPGGEGELTLHSRGAEFSIRIGGQELMNSRASASEHALAELGCARIAGRSSPRVLVGGLGMGYSLATALSTLEGDAQVVVAELVPAVVDWNRDLLGHLAGHPLRDARVSVRVQDVGRVIRERPDAYDAIVLDVDNGPAGLTRAANEGLYGEAGLRAARAALRRQGVLGVWSARSDAGFVRRLRRLGFTVEETAVRARNNGRGTPHVVWLATRD